MANYQNHLFYNVFIYLPLSWIVLVPFNPSISYAIVFMICSVWISPDVDIANKIRATSIRGLLYLPFRPYSMLFRHRGISHWPLIGSVTRMAWVALIAYACYSIYISHPLSYVEINKLLLIPFRNDLLWAALGWVLADLAHLHLDGLSLKRR